MNNKPVAYLHTDGSLIKVDPRVEIIDPDFIPLYTNPVKEQGNAVAWRSQSPDGYWSLYGAPVEGSEPLYTGFKELTDFEIMQISATYPDRLYFARAILRKAQEK